MKKLFCIFFCYLLSLHIAYANDSTELYRKRVQKIKEFSQWLSKKTEQEIAVEGIYYQYDSAANKNWKIFDKAIELFYNKRIIDSIINNESGNDIFEPVVKARIVKGFISRFNDLSHRLEADSLKFRPEQLDLKFQFSEKDIFRARNTIGQYFIIEGQIFEYFSFTFEEGNTKFIEINFPEPQGEEAKKFYHYYSKLKKAS